MNFSFCAGFGMIKRLLPIVMVAGMTAGLSPAVMAQTAPSTDKDPLVPLSPNQALTMNALLGMINGDPIFVQDILRPLDADLTKLAQNARNLNDFKSQAYDMIRRQVNAQVSDRLTMQKAKSSMADEDNQRVEIMLNKVRHDILTQYAGSEAMADQALRARGSSLEKELADRKRKFIRELYLRKTLWPRITVTRAQILNYYETHIKEFSFDAEVDLYTITIPVDRFLRGPDGKRIANPTTEQVKQATDAALAKARDLIQQAKDGADFAVLAEDNSIDNQKRNGGRWPRTRKGSLAREEVEKAAFSLPANSFAEPVYLPEPDPAKARVVIVKVGDAQPARITPFSEAQRDIDSKLRESQWIRLMREFSDRLASEAAVEGTIDRMVDTSTEVAVARYAVRE